MKETGEKEGGESSVILFHLNYIEKKLSFMGLER